MHCHEVTHSAYFMIKLFFIGILLQKIFTTPLCTKKERKMVIFAVAILLNPTAFRQHCNFPAVLSTTNGYQ